MDENLVSQHALSCACSDMMQAGTGRHARGEPPAVCGAGSMYQARVVGPCVHDAYFVYSSTCLHMHCAPAFSSTSSLFSIDLMCGCMGHGWDDAVPVANCGCIHGWSMSDPPPPWMNMNGSDLIELGCFRLELCFWLRVPHASARVHVMLCMLAWPAPKVQTRKHINMPWIGVGR